MKKSIKNILIGSGLGFLSGTIVLFFLYALGVSGMFSGWCGGAAFSFVFLYFTIIKDQDDGKEK